MQLPINLTSTLILFVWQHLIITNAYSTNNFPYSSSSSSSTSQRNSANTRNNKDNKRPQFIIYDPKSGRQLEPLQYLPVVVMGNKRKPSKASGNLVELPQLWNPCSCSELMCMCCLGLQFGENFNHRICVSLQYNSALFSVQMRINHNKRNIVNFGFSASNPPALCVPILIPLPVFTCLRLYNIRAAGGNVQVCMSVVLNVLMNQIFEFPFDCVRFGVNGVQFFKPAQNGVSGIGVGGGGEFLASDEEMFAAGEEQRQNIKLEDNYSGISVEASETEEGFFRKGTVRG